MRPFRCFPFKTILPMLWHLITSAKMKSWDPVFKASVVNIPPCPQPSKQKNILLGEKKLTSKTVLIRIFCSLFGANQQINKSHTTFGQKGPPPMRRPSGSSRCRKRFSSAGDLAKRSIDRDGRWLWVLELSYLFWDD